jgi:hypothetical protein
MATSEAKSKAASFRKFCEVTSKLPKREQWRNLKRLASPNRGNKITPTPEKLQVAEEYFTKIFNNPEVKQAHLGFHWNLETLLQEEFFSWEFPCDEISYYLTNSPLKKAPGSSGLTNEILRAAESPHFCKLLSNMFRFAYVTGTVPESWTKAVIIPVPKKGDLSLIENHRPISLLENIRKIFEKCLHGILTKSSKALSDEQGGFRNSRSTLDQCLILEEIIHSYKITTKKAPVMAFLDIKAAYDSVDRTILLEKLKRFGISNASVESVRQLFNFNRASVKIGEKTTGSFSMPSGVQQGSILSPLLYSIFIDGIRDKLQAGNSFEIYEKPKSLKMMLGKREKFNCLLYADDIVIFGKNADEVQKLVDLAQEYAAHNHFEFNLKKCEFISPTASDKISINGAPIKKVASFTYLGIIFTVKGIDAKAQLEKAQQKCISAVGMIERIGFNGGGFSLKLRIHLYRSTIRSRMEYGIAICPESKEILKLAETGQYKCLCRMLSVYTNTSYKKILAITGLESMKTRFTILKEKFRARYQKLQEGSDSFLVKVIRWKKSVLNQFTKFEFNTAEEESLGLLTGTDVESKEMNKIVLKQFKAQRMKEILQETNKSFQEDLWAVSLEVVQKVLQSTIIEQGKLRSIILFCLNKIPGRNVSCLKCKVNMNLDHFVECKKKIWKEIQIQCSISKFSCNEKKEETRNLPQNGNLISKLLAVALTQNCWTDMKSYLGKIATGIQESAKICVWPGKEEHHVL